MHLSTYIKIGLLLLTTAICYATNQVRDPLTFNGQEGSIEEKPAWPLIQNRNLTFVYDSTANYFGCYSSWSVESNNLYLVSCTGQVKGQGPSGLLTKDIDLKWLFPEAEGKVLAEWFTGTIHLSQGATRLSVWDGAITATDTLIVFHVNKGKIDAMETYLYPQNIDVINKLLSEEYGEPMDIQKMKE